MAPTPTGLETFTVLRSASAPTVQRFGSTCPRAPSSDRPQKGRRSLVMDVEHRGSDHAYPILVDPQVTDHYAWRSDPAAPFTGWFNSGNQPPAFAYHAGDGYRGRGLYVFGKSNYNFYPHPYNPQANQWGSWGQWYFQAPGTSFIYATEYRDVSFDPRLSGQLRRRVHELRHLVEHHPGLGGSLQVRALRTAGRLYPGLLRGL